MPDYRMVCKLKKMVFTDDGYFVPSGTPVEVLTLSERLDDKICCRALRYMYVGLNADDPDWAAVGCGLHIDVDPANLEFIS